MTGSRQYSMMTRMLIFTSVLAILASSGCSDTSTQGTQTTKVVGALLPLSGMWENVGREAQVALEIALPQVNAYLDRVEADFQVEILTRDTGSDPSQAVAALADLKEAGARFIIGPFSSAEAEQCVAYANGNGLTLISPASTSPALALIDNLYRVVPNDIHQARAAAMLMKADGVEMVAVLYMDDIYGKELAEAITRMFSDQGGTTLGTVPFAPGTLDFAPVIGELEALVTGAPAGTENSSLAVFMIPPDKDAVKMLGQISGDSVLNQVKWYASEALARSHALISDPKAAEFAAATGLTAIGLSSEDRYFHVYAHLLEKLVYPELSRLPTAFIFPVWDALWMAAEASRLSTSSVAGSTGSGNPLIRAADTFYGAFGFGEFDANGDKVSARYAFFKVVEQGSGYEWQLSGSYMDEPYAEPMMGRISSAAENGTDGSPLVIGALVPLTGDLSVVGAGFKAALEQAEEDVNAYFSQAGSALRFKVQIEDTQAEPGVAASMLGTLAGQGVRVVVGPMTSACLAAVQDTANGQGLCLISPSSTAVSLAKDDSILRFVPSDGNQARALAALMDADGVGQVLVIFRNDIYGQGLAEAFAGRIAETSGSTVIDSLAYQPGTRDFHALLRQAEQAVEQVSAGGTSGTGLLLIGFEELVDLIKQVPAGSALLKMSWYGSDGIAQSQALLDDAEAGPRAVRSGLTASRISLEGYGLFLPQADTLDWLLYSRNGTGASAYEANAYDAVWVAALAHAKAGDSLDPGQWISVVKKQANWTYGISTPTFLDINGDRSSAAYGLYEIAGTGADAQWKLRAQWRNTGVTQPGLIMFDSPEKNFAAAVSQMRVGTGWDCPELDAPGCPWGHAPLRCLRCYNWCEYCVLSFSYPFADLSNANLRGAVLNHARLFWANLSGADLTGAELDQTYFVGVNLRGATWRDGTKLGENAFIGNEATLIGVNLSRLDLTGADLAHADLRDADLSGAGLWRAWLRCANLRGADLTLAYMLGAGLPEADLRKANLSGAFLHNADLAHADLSGANLSGANLQSADLFGADLMGANLSGANLQSASLWLADLTGANLCGARLMGADLSQATWRDGSQFDQDTQFSRGTDMSYWDLKCLDLSEADLHGAILTGADMQDANLTRANLSNAFMNSANLLGANLTDAVLEGAFLLGATWVDGGKCNISSIGECNQGPVW